jgi:hypothetical protein
MRNSIYRAVGASGIALAAITAAATPSLAAVTHVQAASVQQHVASPVPAGGSSQRSGVLQGPGGGVSQGLHVAQPANPACVATPANGATGPGCANRTSETTRNAINSWNFGGAELGSAAANLVSSAVFGLPSLAIDIIQSLLHSL